MKFRYGSIQKNIDVTSIVYDKMRKKNYIFLPKGDHPKTALFTDPHFGVEKTVFIEDDHQNSMRLEIHEELYIDLEEGKFYKGYSVPYKILKEFKNREQRLEYIHNHLKLDFGSFQQELPEQKITAHFLEGNEKVLELGGNIGRNSLVIAYILEQQKNHNFVVIESDSDSANKLTQNRNHNGFQFSIENAALSEKPMIQKGESSRESAVVLPGYKRINTITLSQLKNKYNIAFDTLIIDCEGAFYNILLDMPEILDGITMIIMENDYFSIVMKNYVDTVLRKWGLNRVYVESGGWGPCSNCFYEVWKKSVSEKEK